MNTTRTVVKLRTKLFILAPEKVDILEMEGFNLTVMTCTGLGDLTKKTWSPASGWTVILFVVRKRNICISSENICIRKQSRSRKIIHSSSVVISIRDVAVRQM